MKWRGTEITELDDENLLIAIRKTLTILNLLWREVNRRRLTWEV